MSEDLIIVRQLPIIEEQLPRFKVIAEQHTKEALSIVCDEESLKTVKEMRAALRKEHEVLESKRKEVKRSILAPYDKFEIAYKENVDNVFNQADAILKKRIDAIEGKIKEDKRLEVKEYFDEYRESLGIPADLVEFSNAGISVTLSISKKALKEQTKKFLDHILEDINVISLQDHSDEIMTEFRTTLNASTAIAAVSLRHRRIEEERKRREEEAADRAERAKAAERVETIVKESSTALSAPCAVEAPFNDEPAPAEAPADEKVYRTTFCVYGTIPQLKSLKDFLTNGGYKYEQQ